MDAVDVIAGLCNRGVIGDDLYEEMLDDLKRLKQRDMSEYARISNIIVLAYKHGE